MAGTEREPESTAPDVSVVTGLIRSGSTSMPKSTMPTHGATVCVSGFTGAAGGRKRTVLHTQRVYILTFYITDRRTDQLHNNSCAWP
eukprot:scaffold63440_cov63-Phaeocystis_antarctica.AAC.5